MRLTKGDTRSLDYRAYGLHNLKGNGLENQPSLKPEGCRGLNADLESNGSVRSRV